MPADLTPLEEDLAAALDRRELARYREVLGTAPPQGADEAARDHAGDFVRGRLRAWGISFSTLQCEAAIGLPGEARVSLARRDAPVAAIAHPYAPGTPPEGLVAELRAVVPGGDADLTGVIALVEGRPDSEGVERLASRGAVAQLYIDPDEEPRPVPAPDRWGGPAATPVVGIGRAVGEGFLALCSAGPTAVRLTARDVWRVRRAPITVATISGADDARDYLLVGAATPGESGGASDPAACLLELCRVFAAHGGRLRRGLRCAWWPGDLAAAAGPLLYADAAWDDLAHHACGYVAMGDAARDPATSGWVELHLRAFAEDALRDGDARRARWSASPPLADLAPFARLGLPTIALGARADDLGALLPVVARLCTAPLPPIDAPALARAVQERIGATLDTLGDRLDLGPLRARAAALYAAAERLQIALLHLAQADSPTDEEGIAVANRLVRQLQRLLIPALRHPGDPYATSSLPTAAPLPGLGPALAYATRPAPRTDTEDLRLRAAAVRERNRLLDALDAATMAIDEALGVLRPLGFG